MKPILTTLTALAVILAASTGAEAGKGPMVNINIKPKLPSVQIRPTRIMPRLPVGTTSRLKKKREQPSEAADGGPQPEPPTYTTKRTRPRTAKVNPVVRFIAPLPRSKPTIPVAAIDPDDLMTIPPDLRGINSEDFQKLKDFQDMASNGPNNAAPDVFGPRQDGGPGDEPGYGGPLGTFDNAANQAEANQENRDKQLEDFRAIAGFDPNNPGGGDTRQGRDFHTPAKNPGAAGGAVNDRRGMASNVTTIRTGVRDNGSSVTVRRVKYEPDLWGVGGADEVIQTRDSKGRVTSQTINSYNENGDLVDSEVEMTFYDDQVDAEGSDPDGQPGVEGRGPGGADNCGWNPMSGCTKKSTPIWKAAVQPGAHQDTDGRAAGPSLGQEAVTNSGDGTFDSGVSGGGGGGGPHNPCDMADCGNGPIGNGVGGRSPAF